MSWIQENKFTASVLGASIVASGVLFYLGSSARSDAEQLRKKSNALVSEANRLKSKEPYPSADNQSLVASKVAEFTASAQAFQKELVAFRPEQLPKLSESAFGSKVSEHIHKLTKLYKEAKIELPEGGKNVAFGFERYKGGALAKEESTRFLDYERKALEWMFTKLAEAQPDSLDNVYRTTIAEETAQATPPNGKGSKRGRGKSTAVESVYRAMPVEITFTGTEHSLKQFLQELSNSKECFFATRAIRVRNEKQESPDENDAKFEQPKTNALEGFEGFGAAEGESTPLDTGSPVIKQVAGEEKLKVHLKLDLLLFNDAEEVTFPGAKKATVSKADAEQDEKKSTTPETK